MKYIIGSILCAGCLFSSVTAAEEVSVRSAEVEQDLNVIIQKTFFPTDEARNAMVQSFGMQALETSDKTMDVDEFINRLGDAFESQEFLSKFYSYFESFLSTEEIHHLRSILEEEVYGKYQGNLMGVFQIFFGEVNTLAVDILEKHGKVKAAESEESKGQVIEVTQDTFTQEVEQATVPVVIDVYANWCGPCRAMKPIFVELSEENSSVKFVKINADNAKELISQLKVTGLPTFIFFKDGKEVGRHVGSIQKDDLQKEITKIFG